MFCRFNAGARVGRCRSGAIGGLLGTGDWGDINTASLYRVTKVGHASVYDYLGDRDFLSGPSIDLTS